MTNVTSYEISSLNNEDCAKILSIIVLGFGSFIFGLLPTAISERNRRRFPLLMSVLLCFGSGILLATALVHMLPSVRKTMPRNSEVVLCGGFFIMYFMDECIHYFSRRQRNFDESPNRQPRVEPAAQCHSYGACSERDILLSEDQHIHVPSETVAGTFGLLCALSLHSFIEGLAIGVQNTKSKVLFLLGAVASHKFVMAFCLGLEIYTNRNSTVRSQLISISIFSLGSVLGIVVGIIIVDLPDTLTYATLPILQALAGGTLLYVTVCEVLPREKIKWHQNESRKLAGFIQFSAVAVGFTVMTLINFYLDDD